MNSVPIPIRLRRRPRDERGYPIPAGVFIDHAGVPQFTVNDEARRLAHLRQNRCPICGERLNGARWFVGGPLSAFDPNGCYFDPPVHDACGAYALQVCPYLAAPRYGRRIDTAKVTPGGPDRIYIDPTQLPDRPDVFVAVLARKTVLNLPYCKPLRPYLRVEYWRHGKRIEETEARSLIDIPALEF